MRRRNALRLCSRLALVSVLGACSSPAIPPTAMPSPTSELPTSAPTRTAARSPTAPPSPTVVASATIAAASGPTVTLPPASTPSSAPPAPSATATGAAPPLSEEDIERHVTALAEIATEHDGRRAAGTAGYDASADYVAAQLDALGWTVERHPFDFTFFDEAAPVSLAVGDASWRGSEWLHANLYSAAGDVQAPLQAVGIEAGLPTETAGCSAEDWAEFLAGRIAVVFGAGCTRRDAVLLAQAAGAVALVSMYPAWTANRVLQPTLIDPAGIEIPAVVVGSEPAAALLDAARTGARAELTVEVLQSPETDDNVVAELAGRSDEVIMLGAHLDSVLVGPGMNDNASGVAALLAIAAGLAAGPPPELTVRLALWGAEEFGTHGSIDYVDGLSATERARIGAYLNLDMVGSPNAVRYVYNSSTAAPGSAEITSLLLGALDDMGAPGLPVDLGGGSDHAAFEGAGIPTGGVFSGIAPLTPEEAALFGGQAGTAADPCYHLPCDDRSNVDAGTALTFASAVEQAVRELAY